ncbi:HTH-type transcriptional repressor PurR [Gimesia alba]|uniref:HTH-type transcriptional repressor PurR n=1 Tax=Gimesia alba TaxID=2527973 RepID=A0A517RDM3_9PLAN|nr:LacI family DNA-binding transcriptional regulator [Gimesia alba]QDT41977.1 HTH-type transcriptional repressor PurR [Gimesia alba]
MPATVKDVAKVAEVSVGTVSRVLSGEPNVSAETARRVRAAVKQLGYSPLRKRRSASDDRRLLRKQIAILLMGMDRSLANLPSVASGIHGVESALSHAGANVLFADLPQMDRLPEILTSPKTHGLLIKAALQGKLIETADAKLINRMRQLPTVWFLGRPDGSDWGDAVESNDAEVGRLAAEYLLARGHQSIAILDPKPGHVTLGQRSASFIWHATQNGARVERVLGEKSNWSIPLQTVNNVELVDQLIRKLLKLRSKPTAVFCPADSITAMAYHCCARRQIQIGKDLSLISCNNELPLLRGLYPEVTTIDICAEQIGRQAVDQLIWRLQHPEAPLVTVSVQPRLVEGMSVVNLKRRKQ